MLTRIISSRVHRWCLNTTKICRNVTNQSRFVEIAVATDLSQEGRFKQAQSLLESSLRDSVQSNGPMHLKTICLERNIASLLIEQGSVLKAEEICKNAIDSISKHFGASKSNEIEIEIVGFKSLLANIYLEKRMYSESEVLFQESLRTYVGILETEKIYEQDEEFLIMKCNYGRALIGLERFEESESVLRNAYSMFLAKHNNKNSPETGLQVYSIYTLKCMDALATCLLLKHNNNDHIDGKAVSIEKNAKNTQVEAEELFRSIVQTYKGKYGSTHRLTLRASANLGNYPACYIAWCLVIEL